MPDTETLVLVYSTWPSFEAAEAAGRSLVEARLAACVNILPGMVSIYCWQGAVERATEVVMLAKTRASLAEPAMQALRRAHPYQVPALMVLPIEAAEGDYRRWLLEETAPLK